MIIYIIIWGFSLFLLFKLGVFKAIWLLIKTIFIFIRYICKYIFKYANIGSEDYKNYYRRKNLYNKLKKIHIKDKYM